MTSSTENSVKSSQIEHLLKITDVMEIIGCARSKVYELVKDGVLPRPIYVTPTMPRWQQKPSIKPSLSWLKNPQNRKTTSKSMFVYSEKSLSCARKGQW